MNTLRIVCLVACLLGASSASQSNQEINVGNKNLKPTQWLSVSDLEALPSMDEITMQKLESMSVRDGANLLEKLYHLSQINHDIPPSFVPSPSNIQTYIMKPNGQKIQANLNEFVDTVKQQPNFGKEEVTIFITGLPQEYSQTVKKTNQKLIQAYMQRYNGQQRRQQNKDYDYGNQQRTSSEEDYTSDSRQPANTNLGNLVVIDLASSGNGYKGFAMYDVERTGAMIGKVLVQLTNEADVPHEIIHIVAQGIASHVAGAAGREYTRLTGHKLRRITALNPSKIIAKGPNAVVGLARGDAEFVDAIHSSTRGMGTRMRVGDVDFYVNGPDSVTPGADNVVEAAMRATRYFAESVRPGNERNFPAVAANSLQQYKNNNGYGKRVYMGIATKYDAKGDYILEVNSKSPFGKSTPAQKQNTYHGVHQPFKNRQMNNQNLDYEQ